MKRKPPEQRERYPLNAAGDFYVENEACMTCMAPHVQAPELMAFDETADHCYFKRQPANREELERAIAAVCFSEIQALRYGGTDEYVLRRLAEEGNADCCDARPGGGRSLSGAISSGVRCLKKLLGTKKLT